jgi:predicted SnoaL-like aldol condensation-catalyzing enzyme
MDILKQIIMESKTYKEIATDFLTLCAKGESRKAFSKYASLSFKHHNIHFKGDAQTLMTAMEENAKAYPHKTFEIKRVLEDGYLVAVHSHAILTPGECGVALMHIFQFDNGKITELWDFGQLVPAETINENGMF